MPDISVVPVANFPGDVKNHLLSDAERTKLTALPTAADLPALVVANTPVTNLPSTDEDPANPFIVTTDPETQYRNATINPNWSELAAIRARLDALEGITTPAAPTTPVNGANSTNNTFGWTDTGGKTYTDAEYSVNTGISYASATANPQPIGPGARETGSVLVRYKAVTGVSNASAPLANAAAFTVHASNPNLLPNSDAFDQWQQNDNATTANAANNSDDATTADKVIPNTNNTTHIILEAITLSDATAYTLTIEAKQAGYKRINIQVKDNNFNSKGESVFDLNTGTKISDGGSPASIATKANGWYEITQTFTTTSTAGFVFIGVQDDSGADSFAGDGVKGIYLAKGKIV